jgi:branched-chain amino acid transport system permease protein
MTPDVLVQTLGNGILLGLTYTAIALGLSLTLGVLGIVNMAHSALLIFGAVVSWQLVNGLGLDPFLALAIVVPLFFVLGALLQMTVLRPVERQPEETGLLLLFGVMIVVESAVLMVWTTDPRTLKLGYLSGSLDLGLVTVPFSRLAAAGIGLVASLALYVFLQHTMLGRATRAMADNRDAAEVMGINTARLSTFVFGLGVALAGVAGVALSIAFTFAPQEHVRWLGWAFLIVIVGGLGSVPATVAAGLAVGITESLLGLFLPFQIVYLVIYVLLAAALLLRGEGLAGARERRM